MPGPALANPNLGYKFDTSTSRSASASGSGWRKHHRSHEAEDDGVAAETDDERRQHGEREAALAGPAPHGISGVTKHV